MHLHTVNDSVQYIGHERDIEEQVRKHRLMLEEIHEFKSLESSGSEQHNGENKETRRGQASQGDLDKDAHRKNKWQVSQLISPSCLPTKFSISSFFAENPSRCSWSFKH